MSMQFETLVGQGMMLTTMNSNVELVVKVQLTCEEPLCLRYKTSLVEL